MRSAQNPKSSKLSLILLSFYQGSLTLTHKKNFHNKSKLFSQFPMTCVYTDLLRNLPLTPIAPLDLTHTLTLYLDGGRRRVTIALFIDYVNTIMWFPFPLTLTNAITLICVAFADVL